MSQHNRTRKQLFKLGLTRRQTGLELRGEALAVAIKIRKAAMRQYPGGRHRA